MNAVDYSHIEIKPGDKIHLILYYDHAETQETIEEIRKNPPLLWCIGKIVNMHKKDDPFYVVINKGAVGRFKKPNWRDIIVKSAVKFMKVIYEIPENFENNE